MAVRDCLGVVPSVEAKDALRVLASAGPGACVYFRYDWIKDWSALAGLDFWDGSEGLTIRLP